MVSKLEGMIFTSIVVEAILHELHSKGLGIHSSALASFGQDHQVQL